MIAPATPQVITTTTTVPGLVAAIVDQGSGHQIIVVTRPTE